MSGDFDVLVSPVIAVPPPPIGWLSDPELGTERLTSILQFTAQFNVSGQPAVSLPLHWSESGLPVGVQFVGPIDDEALVQVRLQVSSPVAIHHLLQPGGPLLLRRQGQDVILFA